MTHFVHVFQPVRLKMWVVWDLVQLRRTLTILPCYAFAILIIVISYIFLQTTWEIYIFVQFYFNRIIKSIRKSLPSSGKRKPKNKLIALVFNGSLCWTILSLVGYKKPNTRLALVYRTVREALN